MGISTRRDDDFLERRDARARLIAFMVRWASRLPDWRIKTMEVLVQSETEGIRLLEAALPGVNDARLRGLFEKHLEDERRHARGFAGRYESLQKRAGLRPTPARTPRGGPARFTVMESVAYLEIQELRGAQVLAVYRDLFGGDDESVAFIDSVVKDEKFHCTYTRLQLERWVEEGLSEQVGRARSLANTIDRRAFLAQVQGFLRVLPRLILKGCGPPVFRQRPAAAISS